MKNFLRGFCGFLLLELYFYGAVQLLEGPVLQFLGLLLFFPFAAIVARWTGLQGLQGLGLTWNKTGLRYFAVSFAIGFCCWGVMYISYWQFGKFGITGVKTGMEAAAVLFQIMIGYFFGSLINDLITRGYIIKHLTGKLAPVFACGISVLLYALDDFLNGEVTVENFVFSCILGTALVYAFCRTGSIWASTGIHFGLNMAYGIVYGLGGKLSDGLLVGMSYPINPLLNTGILLATANILLILTLSYYHGFVSKENLHVPTAG